VAERTGLAREFLDVGDQVLEFGGERTAGRAAGRAGTVDRFRRCG